MVYQPHMMLSTKFIVISVTIENVLWKIVIKLSVWQLICIQFDPVEQI